MHIQEYDDYEYVLLCYYYAYCSNYDITTCLISNDEI